MLSLFYITLLYTKPAVIFQDPFLVIINISLMNTYGNSQSNVKVLSLLLNLVFYDLLIQQHACCLDHLAKTAKAGSFAFSPGFSSSSLDA